MNRMNFAEVLKKYKWGDLDSTIKSMTDYDVSNAFYAEKRNFNDFLALLSPVAEKKLELMAQLAHKLTVQRFGRIIQMFAPVYVSSECINSCVYCGFNKNNSIIRKTLSVDEVMSEANVLHKQGFRHILLVSGESPKAANIDYFCKIARKLQKLFASISIEIYPMDTDSYKALIASGVDGLTIYQETYNQKQYKKVHPAGKKRDFSWRLGTPDRGGLAGFRRINIGALLGLSHWRVESALVGLHAGYLLRKYWKSHICISLPRLRPAAGKYQPEFPVADVNLVQIICALRLWLPDAGIVLSTREPQILRDNLLPLGITQMSAGSKSSPGGYSITEEPEEQFQINDQRTAKDVAQSITLLGYEPVWKDWDAAFLE